MEGANTSLTDFVLAPLSRRAGTASEATDIMDAARENSEPASCRAPCAPGRFATENGAVNGTAARTINQRAQILASMSDDNRTNQWSRSSAN
jgi:hypothetical protein